MNSEDEKSTTSADLDGTVNEPGTPTRQEAADDRKTEAAQKLTPAQKAAAAKAAREKKAAEAAAQAQAEAAGDTEPPAQKLTPAQKAAAAKAAREKKAAEAAAQAQSESAGGTDAPATDAGDTEAPAQKLTPAQKAAAAKAAREKKAAEEAAQVQASSATAKPAPAKKDEAKPSDPRVVAATETAERLAAALKQQFGEAAVEEAGAAHHHPLVRIHPSHWADAVDWLKTHADWQLNYVECMAGTDYPDYIEIVLYVQSTERNHFICLKTRTSRDTAEVPSLVTSHPGVNWEEREIYDLLGVKFTNHPDLRRIMMWDDFKGHPLRKDYSEWESR